MKLAYLSGLLAAFLLLSACTPPQPASPAPPREEVSQPQDIPARDPYEAFLAEKAYLTGEPLPYGEPTGFCRKDLDGDGKDELLLVSGSETEFGGFRIYTAPRGTVEPVPVETEHAPQFFQSLRFSPAENALVFTEIRPSYSVGGYGFWKMEAGVLKLSSSVTWDEVCVGQVTYYHQKDGKSASITAEEKDAILAEPQALEFTPIG